MPSNEVNINLKSFCPKNKLFNFETKTCVSPLKCGWGAKLQGNTCVVLPEKSAEKKTDKSVPKVDVDYMFDKLFYESTIRGRNCPRNDCLNNNKAYYDVYEATTACKKTAGCDEVMKYNENGHISYYLRRNTDPTCSNKECLGVFSVKKYAYKTEGIPTKKELITDVKACEDALSNLGYADVKNKVQEWDSVYYAPGCFIKELPSKTEFILNKVHSQHTGHCTKKPGWAACVVNAL